VINVEILLIKLATNLNFNPFSLSNLHQIWHTNFSGLIPSFRKKLGEIINKIEKNGTLVEEIATQNSSYNIPDLAINGNSLYYLRYSENQPVIKLNLSSKNESAIPSLESTGTYSLTVSTNEIITISALNEISHHDIASGTLISKKPTIFKGWITAIAPYYTNEE